MEGGKDVIIISKVKKIIFKNIKSMQIQAYTRLYNFVMFILMMIDNFSYIPLLEKPLLYSGQQLRQLLLVKVQRFRD